MQERANPVLVFFLTGLVLWALGGFLAAMVCFQPAVPLEMIQKDKELAIEVSNALGATMLKIAVLWGLIGGILGVVICYLFIARPQYEHFFSAPRPQGMIDMPGFLSGPQTTMAEINAGLQSWVLGTIIGVCGTVFILPLLQSELVVVNKLEVRIIFGVIQTLIVTVPILPFSLWITIKRHRRRY